MSEANGMSRKAPSRSHGRRPLRPVHNLLRYLVARIRNLFDADEMTADILIYQKRAYIEASAVPLGLVRKNVHAYWVDRYRPQAPPHRPGGVVR
ncbi:hypothetical protein ACFC4G_47920 [Streptomyces sp. NPDC056002]|uniref:hypothetical protein n=1 Tax=Streptomyces sp. NPDC056002 TaxID=3345675 RepID=UPI0035DCF3FF